MPIKFIWISVLFMFFGCQQKEEKIDPVFKSLDSDYTGITFNNHIPDDIQYSVMSYEYTYNGSGVAIGDINNDGLEDIFFGANISSSKLYLNKGDLNFEDITTTAKIETDVWVTGVVMVDINNDGWLDIYVCVAGNVAENQRANLLFINNKDLTFTESAKKYGLAETSFSTQAAFFDFDRDGYLDCYLMNHSNADRNASYLAPINKKGTAKSTDKLFRNLGNGYFEDVSAKAGISVEGYGLGLIVQDFNKDGWPDIFVANDYIYNDLLYINKQDGTFIEKAQSFFPYNSQFAMGVDVGDINNDGFFDLMELDMLPPDNRRRKLLAGSPNYKRFEMASNLGYTNQFMRNTLYLGGLNDYFNEVGIFAGVNATDWSWSVLIQDYNNDGKEDIHITNGYLKNITDLDFASYSNLQKGARIREGDDRERVKDAIKNLKGAKLSNYVFENNGNLNFIDRSEAWGVKRNSFSNGAAYADLDNDGDLEMVVSNINDQAFLYENVVDNGSSFTVELKGDSINPFAEGSQVKVSTYSQKEHIRTKTSSRGYLSSVSQYLHFGLDQLDSVKSVEILWPDGKCKFYELKDGSRSLIVDYSKGKEIEVSQFLSRPQFDYELVSYREETRLQSDLIFYSELGRGSDFDYQSMLPKEYSKAGPYFTFGDINQDGLEDIYFGGSEQKGGTIAFQDKNGYFKLHQSLEVGFQDKESALIDVNGDGHLDLIVLTGGYNLYPKDFKLSTRLYLNDGKGTFKRDFDILPSLQGNHSCLAITDFNKDGQPDIFIGGNVYPMKFPLPEKSGLLVYENGGYRNIASEIEGLERVGIVNDAIWTDIDNDDWEDLLVIGEFMEPTFFKNYQGKLKLASLDFGSYDLAGHWNVVKSHDFDGDGKQDFLLGNMGSNSIFSGTAENPIKIFAADYDGNGSIDPIISYSIDQNDYPFHPRDMLMHQLPYLKKNFTSYKAFSEATVEDVLTREQLAKSYRSEINFSESIILKNRGQSKFEVIELPKEVNQNWVKDALIQDIDQDGLADILLIGNENNNEVSFGHVIADVLLVLTAKNPFEFEKAEVNLKQANNFTSTSQISQLKIGRDLVYSLGFTNDTLRFYQLNELP